MKKSDLKNGYIVKERITNENYIVKDGFTIDLDFKRRTDLRILDENLTYSGTGKPMFSKVWDHDFNLIYDGEEA